MLVFCVGMPKSGSEWFLHIVDDLLACAGFSHVADIVKEYGLDQIVKYEGNIQRPTAEKINLLTRPPLSAHTFAVKTHFRPNEHVVCVLESRLAKAGYIYRDPRDVILSALDAGVRSRELSNNDDFTRLFTFKDALQWIMRWIIIWDEWTAIKGVHLVKYEDLLADSPTIVKGICDFLGVKLEDEIIANVINRYEPACIKGTSLMGSLHFNKGIGTRYKDEMTAEQKRQCLDMFGHYLEKMGYEV
jgi:hypothetical protein